MKVKGKVFCGNCKNYSQARLTQFFAVDPEEKCTAKNNTIVLQTTYKGELKTSNEHPAVINHDNDCPWFEAVKIPTGRK